MEMFVPIGFRQPAAGGLAPESASVHDPELPPLLPEPPLEPPLLLDPEPPLLLDPEPLLLLEPEPPPLLDPVGLPQSHGR